MNLETKIIIYKFTPQVFTLTHYLALYRIRIYTLVLTELQYICAILEQII